MRTKRLLAVALTAGCIGVLAGLSFQATTTEGQGNYRPSLALWRNNATAAPLEVRQDGAGKAIVISYRKTPVAFFNNDGELIVGPGKEPKTMTATSTRTPTFTPTATITPTETITPTAT